MELVDDGKPDLAVFASQLVGLGTSAYTDLLSGKFYTKPPSRLFCFLYISSTLCISVEAFPIVKRNATESSETPMKAGEETADSRIAQNRALGKLETQAVNSVERVETQISARTDSSSVAGESPNVDGDNGVGYVGWLLSLFEVYGPGLSLESLTDFCSFLLPSYSLFLIFRSNGMQGIGTIPMDIPPSSFGPSVNPSITDTSESLFSTRLTQASIAVTSDSYSTSEPTTILPTEILTVTPTAVSTNEQSLSTPLGGIRVDGMPTKFHALGKV